MTTAACDTQLRVTPPGYGEYARAAALLWGEAGEYAAAEFGRLNREHFAGSIPPLPIVVGLAAYGHCIGLTRHRGTSSWLDSPRISLAPEVFRGSEDRPNGSPGRMHGGPRQVSDVPARDDPSRPDAARRGPRALMRPETSTSGMSSPATPRRRQAAGLAGAWRQPGRRGRRRLTGLTRSSARNGCGRTRATASLSSAPGTNAPPRCPALVPGRCLTAPRPRLRASGTSLPRWPTPHGSTTTGRRAGRLRIATPRWPSVNCAGFSKL